MLRNLCIHVKSLTGYTTLVVPHTQLLLCFFCNKLIFSNHREERQGILENTLSFTEEIQTIILVPLTFKDNSKKFNVLSDTVFVEILESREENVAQHAQTIIQLNLFSLFACLSFNSFILSRAYERLVLLGI